MPATQIAHNLAFINWTVLSALAFGSYGAAVLLRRRTSATSGFLGFTAVAALGFGVLAWLSDGGLPDSLGGSPVVVDPAWDGPRRTAILAFVVFGAAAVLLRRFRPAMGRGLDLAAVGAALLTLLFGALSWGGTTPTGVAGLLVQLAVLAAATGGVFAAMILGHWYLVTPKLPESPLLLLSRILVAVIAAQVVLFAVWVATAAGPAGGAPFSALTGEWALFVWLRLIIGLIFPLVVSVGALKTAATRSMESATGLQYINVGTIAAGTILAAGLYFGAGLLV